mmetsp:Transcript_31725/g.76839  ORF Transcript_31725/g.76839 Transcript_31725/m.76839 type:complete len:307 (-) Transcript_31725:946-1866(-)
MLPPHLIRQSPFAKLRLNVQPPSLHPRLMIPHHVQRSQARSLIAERRESIHFLQHAIAIGRASCLTLGSLDGVEATIGAVADAVDGAEGSGAEGAHYFKVGEEARERRRRRAGCGVVLLHGGCRRETTATMMTPHWTFGRGCRTRDLYHVRSIDAILPRKFSSNEIFLFFDFFVAALVHDAPPLRDRILAEHLQKAVGPPQRPQAPVSLRSEPCVISHIDHPSTTVWHVPPPRRGGRTLRPRRSGTTVVRSLADGANESPIALPSRRLRGRGCKEWKVHCIARTDVVLSLLLHYDIIIVIIACEQT